MIPLVYIVGAVAAAFVIDAKVKPIPGLAKYNPLSRNDNVPHPASPAAPVPSNVPASTVDGHGTGIIPDSQLAAAAAQAAAQAKASGLGLPGGGKDPQTEANRAAFAAAENMKIEIMKALNTPEGDRSPEQLVLLQGLGGLPVIGGK